MTTEIRRPAGWYDDQSDAAVLRYWDGSAWSPHTTPKPAQVAPTPTLANVAHTVKLTDVAHAVVDATTVRWVSSEHTTMPLPEPGSGSGSGASRPRLSYELYRGPGLHTAWIIAAGAVAVVLLSAAVSSMVALSLH